MMSLYVQFNHEEECLITKYGKTGEATYSFLFFKIFRTHRLNYNRLIGIHRKTCDKAYTSNYSHKEMLGCKKIC